MAFTWRLKHLIGCPDFLKIQPNDASSQDESIGGVLCPLFKGSSVLHRPRIPDSGEDTGQLSHGLLATFSLFRVGQSFEAATLEREGRSKKPLSL